MRSQWIDATRGFAIALVVVGHSIQFGAQGRLDYFSSPAFVAIYAFHMPLFVVLTGYLVAGTFEKREPWAIIRSRVSALLIPFVSWTLVFGGAYLLATGVRGLGALTRALLKLFVNPMGTVWFLWFAFAATALLAIAVALSRVVGPWLIPASAVVPFLLPLEDALAFFQLRWLYPFLVMGFLGRRHAKRLGFLADPRFGAFMATVYLICFVFWERDFSVYVDQGVATGDSFGEALSIWVLRYVFAFSGCVVVTQIVRLWSQRHSSPTISRLGRASLGIYCVQTYIMRVLANLPSPSESRLLFYCVYVPLSTVAILAGSLWFTVRILDRTDILRRMFLGGRSTRTVPRIGS